MDTDKDKAQLLNRTFASKFADTGETTVPPAPDYGIDSLSTFELSEDLVLSVLLQTDKHKGPGT